MKTSQKNQIADTVKQMRQAKGLSQLELASIAGIDRKTVNRIENGHFMPSIDTLVALGNALNTTTSKLIGS